MNYLKYILLIALFIVTSRGKSQTGCFLYYEIHSAKLDSLQKNKIFAFIKKYVDYINSSTYEEKDYTYITIGYPALQHDTDSPIGLMRVHYVVAFIRHKFKELNNYNIIIISLPIKFKTFNGKEAGIAIAIEKINLKYSP